MTALSRELIVTAKARADAATEGPWRHIETPYGESVEVDDGDEGAQLFIETHGVTYAWNGSNAEFVASAREDVPVMADALLRVFNLHRRAHAVFSWNSGMKYEDPCSDCDGKAGVHDCGCWADSDIEYVCVECHRLGSRSGETYDYAWPCATVRAVTGDGSSSNTERGE